MLRTAVPYELTFTHPIAPSEAPDYINDCCFGGDVITARLVPLVTARYEDVDTGQEDWGWFIWFRHGDDRLAIDVHCHDSTAGEFAIHLVSRQRRRLFRDVVLDLPELDVLLKLVKDEIAAWLSVEPIVTRMDPSEYP